MSETNQCPECGATLPASVQRGLCPACLLKRGLESNTGGPTVPSEGAAASNRWVPPAVEELAARFPELDITRLIGRGGMGAVYQARQKSLDRIVALKILPPEIGRDPAFAERFAREAQAMARLNHSNIVTLYEFGQRGELFFFIMEYVDGMSLRGLLDTGHVSPKEALAIVPQICEALQYAHEHGIVHRDIKPENILLNKQGQVKIADFGLAKLVGRTDVKGLRTDSKDSTQSSALITQHSALGTPQYMAPEQMERPADVDHRADIYSLGVVFYQMLTGELPKGKFEPPSRKVFIDVRLDEVVLKALEREPEKRYQQASEVKTEVETIAGTPAPPESRVKDPPQVPVSPRRSGDVWRLLAACGCAFLAAGFINRGDYARGGLFLLFPLVLLVERIRKLPHPAWHRLVAVVGTRKGKPVVNWTGILFDIPVMIICGQIGLLITYFVRGSWDYPNYWVALTALALIPATSIPLAVYLGLTGKISVKHLVPLDELTLGTGGPPRRRPAPPTPVRAMVSYGLSVLVWLLILVVLCIIAPRFNDILSQMGATLPPLTEGVLSLSRFATHFGILFLPLIFLIPLPPLLLDLFRPDLHTSFVRRGYRVSTMTAAFLIALVTVIGLALPVVEMTTYVGGGMGKIPQPAAPPSNLPPGQRPFFIYPGPPPARPDRAKNIYISPGTTSPGGAPSSQSRFQIRLALDPAAAETQPSDPFPDPYLPAHTLNVARSVLLDESSITSASVARENGLALVRVHLTKNGSVRFADFTARYVHHAMAIFLDGRLLSAPMIASGGITDSFPVLPNTPESELPQIAATLNAIASKEAPATLPAPPAFGPVHELFLPDHHQSKDTYLSLDNGQLHTMPDFGHDSTAKESFQKWIQANHIDLIADTSAEFRGLEGLDLVALPISLWSKFQPTDLQNNLRDLAPGTYTTLSGKGDLPVTYIFKTRAGVLGILQIEAFQESPPAVKIRYKLVQQAAIQPDETHRGSPE